MTAVERPAAPSTVPVRVAFNRPSTVGDELLYVQQAIANRHLSGDGQFTRRCRALLEQSIGVRQALLTTSCTHALEMAALLLDLAPGDEVIVPAFTFVSTVNAFVLRGARPVFADVRPDTLNLDEERLEQLITPRTKAIVLVHYAGVACEMGKIMQIAGAHSIPIIEDNAHGLFATYAGRQLGTFGAMATLSFHETKNFSCGEGGALLTNDEAYVQRAEIIREKGTNRSRFFRGEVDKYTWVDVGSSYLPSDILAAFLLAQLERRDEIQSGRQRIWQGYLEGLTDWARAAGAQLPTVPAKCEHPAHLFYILMPTPAQRGEMIESLRGNGIQAVFHYQPLHLSDMGRRFGGQSPCPITESVSDRLLRLPLHNSLSEGDVELVVSAVKRFSA